MPRAIPFSEADLRAAIEQSVCWADALRFLGYVPKGSNFKTLKKYATQWRIPTDHFDPHTGQRRAALSQAFPLEEILVANSTYPRGKLKRRLLRAGLKRPFCEMCGQLMEDVKSMSMVAVGRKYGVSDNAVRKWIRWYEYRQKAA
jgi:hypothetical protein